MKIGLISEKDQKFVDSIRSKINLPDWSLAMSMRGYLELEKIEEMNCFKVWVAYNKDINDVAIHLDKEGAKDLMLYLIRSVLMDFEYKDGKSEVVGCYNAIPVEAACGNEHSQHVMDIRNKLIELMDSEINKIKRDR